MGINKSAAFPVLIRLGHFAGIHDCVTGVTTRCTCTEAERMGAGNGEMHHAAVRSLTHSSLGVHQGVAEGTCTG